MSKFVEFPGLKGPVLINVDQIVAVFPDIHENGPRTIITTGVPIPSTHYIVLKEYSLVKAEIWSAE